MAQAAATTTEEKGLTVEFENGDGTSTDVNFTPSGLQSGMKKLGTIMEISKLVSSGGPEFKDLTREDVSRYLTFAKTLADHPEGSEKLLAYLKAHPEHAAEIRKMSKYDPAASEAVKNANAAKANSTLEFAVTQPEKFQETLPEALKLKAKADSLMAKLDSISAAHPDFKSLAALKKQLEKQQTPELKDLTKEKMASLTANADKVDQVMDIFANPKFKESTKVVDGILAKYLQKGSLDPKNLEGNPALAQFLDKAKLEKFMENSEILLTGNGKALKQWAVDNFDPSAAADPESAKLFSMIYNNPESLKFLNDRLNPKENPDGVALLTGKLDLNKVAEDIPGFLKRNHTLLATAQDPFVSQLLSNSKLGKQFPGVLEKLQSSSSLAMAKVLGLQDDIPHENETPDQKKAREEKADPLSKILAAIGKGDWKAVMGAIVAMFIGGSSGQSPMDLFKGTGQQNGVNI